MNALRKEWYEKNKERLSAKMRPVLLLALGVTSFAMIGCEGKKTASSTTEQHIEQSAQQTESLTEARKELTSMLQTISGGEMEMHTDGSVTIRNNIQGIANEEPLNNPTGYYKLDKSVLAQLDEFVQKDYIEGKFGDPKWDRDQKEMTMHSLKVKIAQLGQPVQNASELSQKLHNAGKTDENPDQQKSSSPEQSQPEHKINPAASDYL